MAYCKSIVGGEKGINQNCLKLEKLLLVLEKNCYSISAEERRNLNAAAEIPGKSMQIYFIT